MPPGVKSRLASVTRRFARDQSGAVALIFGLMLIPMAAMIGLAVDFGRVYAVNSSTQGALDAAALAAGRVAQVETESMIEKASAAATAYFDQAKPKNVVDSALQFSPNSNQTEFKVTATTWVRTPFLNALNFIIGKASQSGAPSGCQGSYFECVRLKTTSTATLKVGGNSESNIEVSLILDMTGSMCSGGTQPCSSSSKMDPLKLAAKDLIDIVVWDDQGTYKSRVSIVPYSMGVNAGTYAQTVRGSITKGCTKQGCDRFSFKNPAGQTKTHNISDCVSERTGADAYTDASPSGAKLGRNYPAPSNGCLSSTITPLSSDKTALKGQIDALKASGSTAGHIGVAWGWYMISPNWATIWPATSQPGSYSDLTNLNAKGAPKLKKIAVLMSDGEYNSSYCNGVISQDSTTGSGNPSDHINCNAPNGHSFNQAQSLCSNIKAAKIEVFTVGFNIVDDQRARDLMTQCATDSDHVYLATTGDALRQAFRDIALKIASLRLTN